MQTQRNPLIEDGAEWILEGKVRSPHNVVVQTSPRSGCIYDIGLMLMRFSGLPIKGLY